jgi:hypothetical protein
MALVHESIEDLMEYSKHHIGCTLGEAIKLAKEKNPSFPDIGKNFKITDKGLLGKILETYLFGIKNNSSPKPDFDGLIKSGECAPDLKVTKIVEYEKYPGKYRAKERLTCTNINREKLANCEVFVNSCYKDKCSNILLFVLEYKKCRTFEELMDIKILHVMHVNLYEKYKDKMDKDWLYINNMAKDNTVKLSQKGQMCLHVHPHGSKGSTQRALGLKNKFLTEIIGDDLEKEHNEQVTFRKGRMTMLKLY